MEDCLLYKDDAQRESRQRAWELTLVMILLSSRNRLEAGCPNYAYEILLLEIIVEDDLYHRKPTIEEISRLIQLYMVRVYWRSWLWRYWKALPTSDTTTSNARSIPLCLRSISYSKCTWPLARSTSKHYRTAKEPIYRLGRMSMRRMFSLIRLITLRYRKYSRRQKYRSRI